MNGDYVDRKIIFKYFLIFLEALIDSLSLFVLYLELGLVQYRVDAFRFTMFDSRHFMIDTIFNYLKLNFNIETF